MVLGTSRPRPKIVERFGLGGEHSGERKYRPWNSHSGHRTTRAKFASPLLAARPSRSPHPSGMHPLNAWYHGAYVFVIRPNSRHRGLHFHSHHCSVRPRCRLDRLRSQRPLDRRDPTLERSLRASVESLTNQLASLLQPQSSVAFNRSAQQHAPKNLNAPPLAAAAALATKPLPENCNDLG
jgi:hypothetical protein